MPLFHNNSHGFRPVSRSCKVFQTTCVDSIKQATLMRKCSLTFILNRKVYKDCIHKGTLFVFSWKSSKHNNQCEWQAGVAVLWTWIYSFPKFHKDVHHTFISGRSVNHSMCHMFSWFCHNNGTHTPSFIADPQEKGMMCDLCLRWKLSGFTYFTLYLCSWKLSFIWILFLKNFSFF